MQSIRGCYAHRWFARYSPHAVARSAMRTRASAAAEVDTEEDIARLEVEDSGRIAGFPFTDSFKFRDERMDSDRVIKLLSPLVSDERMAKIERVVSQRTYTVLPVVEGIYDLGNLAAVCRSADAFGLGAVHCIKNGEKYKKSRRIAAGSEKWLETRVWGTTAECLSSLKQAGYQVVVTHLSSSATTIQEVDWTRPTAVVLGNEKSGVSQEAVQLADACAIFPMAGYVESFNISVAAALIFYEAQQQRVRRLGQAGDLSAGEQRILKAVHIMRSLKKCDTILQHLLERPPPAWQEHLFRDRQEEL